MIKRWEIVHSYVEILVNNKEDVRHVYTGEILGQETSIYSSKERHPKYLPREDFQKAQIQDLSQNQSFLEYSPNTKKRRKKTPTDIRIGTFNVQSIKGNMTYVQEI